MSTRSIQIFYLRGFVHGDLHRVVLVRVAVVLSLLVGGHEEGSFHRFICASSLMLFGFDLPCAPDRDSE